MTDPRILLANEAGGGRGHVTLLAAVARGLGQSLPVAAALPGLRYADALAPLGVTVVQGPVLRYLDELRADSRRAGNATWGDYLANCGLGREEIVRAHLRWWRRKIVEEDASILVADSAPVALWAARGLKEEGWEIESLSVGTGYGLPPARLDRFPQLLPDYRSSKQSEEETLAAMNRVAAQEGLGTLARLPAVAAADQEIAFTLPFLDPYSADRAVGETFVPVPSELPQIADGTGGELFVYFARNELDDAALVEALAALAIPRRGFLPAATAATRDRLAASGMIVEPAPLPMAAIASRSRLILSAGQHGMLCLSALAGIPQIALPQHLEQLFHARRAAARGILRCLPFDQRQRAEIEAGILNAWSDTALASRARDSAKELRAAYPDDPAALLSARLAPFVERARNAYR